MSSSAKISLNSFIRIGPFSAKKKRRKFLRQSNHLSKFYNVNDDVELVYNLFCIERLLY